MSTTIREQLRTLSFLDGLTDTALHQLSRLVKPAEYECDALLFTEGSERKLLAIVVSGAVAIEKQINGRPIRLATKLAVSSVTDLFRDFLAIQGQIGRQISAHALFGLDGRADDALLFR